MPPRPLHPFTHPYRLFHLSARLRLRDRPPTTPSPSSSYQTTPPDDYYALLLSTPTPSPVATPKNSPSLPPATPQPSSTAAAPTQPSATAKPDNRILFGRDVSGPSPAARGLERAEKGLERPPEPDNCCMSGCVNCVWDAYREEVEGWAAARKLHAQSSVTTASGGGGGDAEGDEGSGVGDMDGVGGFERWSAGGGEEGEDEDALFEGVPVGIREFMKQEKRIRERRGEDAAQRSYEGRSIESWRVDTKREEKRV